MTDRLDVTVAALIEHDGRFLLVKERAQGRIVYNQPAGHAESRESFIDAVTRETREETGYAFLPTSLLGLYLWHCTEIGTSFLRLAFCGEASPPAREPMLDSGIIATEWLTRAQVLAREPQLRSPLVLQCIDDYRANRRYPLACLTEVYLTQAARLSAS